MLFQVWDPWRTSNHGVIIESHSGAHVLLDENDNIQLCNVNGAQQVVGSIGGVQTLIFIIRSVLQPGDSRLEVKSLLTQGKETEEMLSLCSLVPDVFYLLSAFIYRHQENSREMLRCGIMEDLEALLFDCLRKRSNFSVFDALSTFPSVAALLVQRLLELRSVSKDYVGLETEVLSRILFNVPLWFGGLCQGDGVAMALKMIPELNSIVKASSHEVLHCVRVHELILFLQDLIMIQVRFFVNSNVFVVITYLSPTQLKNEESVERTMEFFERKHESLESLSSGLKIEERDRIIDILLAWIFQVFQTGCNVENFALFLALLSKNLGRCE
jgi:hypothetical protein